MPGARRAARLASALPLEYFVRRGQVLSQYRAFMRALRRLEANSADAAQMREQVRQSFRENMSETDARIVSAHLAEGKAQLAQIDRLASIAAPGADGSWVGSHGMSDRDTLGRMGSGWPWAR